MSEEFWKKTGELFMEKMLGKDWQKLTHKKWEKLEWTESDQDEFHKWAVEYLRKKRILKYIAEKEVMWFLLQYAPRVRRE